MTFWKVALLDLIDYLNKKVYKFSMSHRSEGGESYRSLQARHGLCSDHWPDSVRRRVFAPPTPTRKVESQEPKVVIREVHHHHYVSSQASGCLLPLALAVTFGLGMVNFFKRHS